MKAMYLLLKVLRLQLCMKIFRRRIKHTERKLSAINARLTEVSCNLAECESRLREILFHELQPLHQDGSRNGGVSDCIQMSEEYRKLHQCEIQEETRAHLRAVDEL